MKTMSDGATLIRKDLAYFSHVRLTATQSGSTPNFIQTMAPSNPVRAFGYAKGDDMTAAGRASTTATECDTNLQNKGETLDGEDVLITGVKLQPTGESDPFFISKLFRNLSVKISLNGGDRAMLLGNAEMVPGGCGFFVGPGVSTSSGLAVPSIGNGWPDDANYYPIPSGILWQRKGKTDSSLVVLINVERTVTYTVNNASSVAAVADLRVQLVCTSVADRSPNL